MDFCHVNDCKFKKGDWVRTTLSHAKNDICQITYVEIRPDPYVQCGKPDIILHVEGDWDHYDDNSRTSDYIKPWSPIQGELLCYPNGCGCFQVGKFIDFSEKAIK